MYTAKVVTWSPAKGPHGLLATPSQVKCTCGGWRRGYAPCLGAVQSRCSVLGLRLADRIGEGGSITSSVFATRFAAACDRMSAVLRASPTGRSGKAGADGWRPAQGMSPLLLGVPCGTGDVPPIPSCRNCTEACSCSLWHVKVDMDFWCAFTVFS